MERASSLARQPKYWVLLTVLVVSYLLSASASEAWVGVVQVALFLWIAALAVRTAQVSRKVALLAIAVVTAGSAIVAALMLADPTTVVQGAANTWKAVLLAFAVILTVSRVLAQPEVTIQSIYGALSAYMITGLMFAACYGALDKFGGGHFFATGQPGNLQTFQYFSFTTLTTLGYGDFTAAHSGGRAVAVLEAMLGQVFLATLVARLVSAFRSPRRPRARRRARASARARVPRRSGPRREPR